MDLKTFLDVLKQGSPFAILIGLVGLLWQFAYGLLRDRAHDKQTQRELALERQKFEHQRTMEELKFDYQQRQWRETLGRDLMLKLVDARLEEYSKAWALLEGVAQHHSETLTPESAKSISVQVKEWRYSRGGLLAEETTREAALAFQQALWRYDGSRPAYRLIRQARSLLRDALRADMGLSGDIYQRTEERFQTVHQELIRVKEKLAARGGGEASET